MVLRQVNTDAQLPHVVLQDPNAHAEAPLILDEQRFTAAWTGENCVMWCGSVAGVSVSVAGNMLANEHVVAATFALSRANAWRPTIADEVAAQPSAVA